MEEFKKLVKQARDNVDQNQIGTDSPVTFRFGETVHFTDGGAVNGLFKVNDNGEQENGLEKSIYSDGSLENRSGFRTIIEKNITKNKRSS